MKTVKVRVTKKDLMLPQTEKDWDRRSRTCPTARAILRHFPRRDVRVGFGTVWIGDKVIRIDKRIGWRIWRVDCGDTKPFTFTLKVPS